MVMKKEELPNTIPIFPLSNFIIFPKTTVPLNIFEPRYIQMVNECMKGNRIIGMVQPKKSGSLKKPDLYEVGCAGKITSFNETDDGRYLIILKGISRFRIIKEEKSEKLYRKCIVNFEEFHEDMEAEKEKVKFSELKLILNGLKIIFEKQGYLINWSEFEKKKSDQTLNALSMASPFSLEEKQVLLESKNLIVRKERFSEILNTYIHDNFSNSTLQ